MFIEDVVNQNLPKFFITNSKKLLQHLDKNSFFLDIDSVTWEKTAAYVEGK